jgi:anti-anti-sigma regulatory factor
MADPVPLTPAHTEPVVVTLPAETGMANARAVRDQLAPARAPGALIIADMTATTFCDSMGIRALVLAHNTAAAHGACLRLLLSCPHLMRGHENPRP